MDFVDHWIETFCQDCDADGVNLYVKEYGFIWHAFSYELIDRSRFLEGADASKAFDSMAHKEALYYVFFPEEERVVQEVEDGMDSAFFDEFIEVYVVAKDDSWTYIKTHESCMGLGPYFYRKNH